MAWFWFCWHILTVLGKLVGANQPEIKFYEKKLTKFCLLWQNNVCSFSVTEINSTVKGSQM